jgi:hypothetical protein
MDWRDSDHVTCFLCGLRYATIELCFLRCPCRVYITRVRLQLRRVQEGSAVGSTRTRMSVSLVNCENKLSTVRTEEYRVIEDEITRRLHSDLKR